MRSALRYRPSPPMVVGLVALFLAMGGVGYALPGSNTVTSGDIVNGQVKTRDIKNNDLRSRDIRRGAVRSSDVRNDSLTRNDVNESTLGTVPRARTAGTAESPAYTHILADGTVDSARSKGIANATVTHPSAGNYCLDNLGFTPKSVTGNVDSADGPGAVQVSTVPANFRSCPATAQVEVRTFWADNTPPNVRFRDFSGGFYLIFN
jgi:hypothetical protein